MKSTRMFVAKEDNSREFSLHEFVQIDINDVDEIALIVGINELGEMNWFEKSQVTFIQPRTYITAVFVGNKGIVDIPFSTKVVSVLSETHIVIEDYLDEAFHVIDTLESISNEV